MNTFDMRQHFEADGSPRRLDGRTDGACCAVDALFGPGKQYAVYPGRVTSKNDGQEHWIGFMRLCELYRVAPGACVDMSQEKDWRGKDVSALIRLAPRYDGNYALPNAIGEARAESAASLPPTTL